MISRRDLLKFSGLAAASSSLKVFSSETGPADYKLEIAPVTLDLSPRHKLKTHAYNGQVPGPLLRLKENRPATIEVTNRTDHPEVIHWHGLLLPSAVDGAMEEGTPPIAKNETRRYTFVPRPGGFRWYHTHTMAMGDLTRAQYGGQHGFLMIEPQVLSMLRLAPGERVCATVEMRNPGVWILGEVRKHVQATGMAIVVEYANESGIPRWRQPADLIWNYEQFSGADADAEPAESPTLVPLMFESKFRGHGSMEAWTINGRSYPESGVPPLTEGRRYRLRFINRSMDDHPVHLHRHSFELHSLGAPLDGVRQARPGNVHGIVKDVLLVDAQTSAEVDFTANNPGASLFHCHQQNHMDLGFMMLFTYG